MCWTILFCADPVYLIMKLGEGMLSRLKWHCTGALCELFVRTEELWLPNLTAWGVRFWKQDDVKGRFVASNQSCDVSGSVLGGCVELWRHLLIFLHGMQSCSLGFSACVLLYDTQQQNNDLPWWRMHVVNPNKYYKKSVLVFVASKLSYFFSMMSWIQQRQRAACDFSQSHLLLAAHMVGTTLTE